MRNIEKKQIQLLLEHLFDTALDFSGKYYNFTDKDLFMATSIFSFFLMDKMWSENTSLSPESRIAFAEETGRTIRDIVFIATNKDMRKVVRNELQLQGGCSREDINILLDH